MGVGDIVWSFGKYLSNSFCMMNGFVKIELPSDRSVRRIPRNIPFSLLVTVYLAESHRKKDTAYVGPLVVGHIQGTMAQLRMQRLRGWKAHLPSGYSYHQGLSS